MEDQRTLRRNSVMTMERDILKAVAELGPINPGDEGQWPATDYLARKYPSEAALQQLTVVVNHLLEERLLFPYFSTDGRELKGSARGITPKGLDRLERLEHPVRSWVYDNWFGVIVASVASLIGLANVAISAVLIFR